MASIEMKLKPWQTPNYAQVELPSAPKQEGVRELPSVHVSELSLEALDDLARQWLTDLYNKAGKRDQYFGLFTPRGKAP